MSPALADFLFEAANFLVLAAVLGWLLFRPVRKALAAEREQHDGLEQRASALRTEAEVLTEQARAAKARLSAELEAERAERRAAAQREASELQQAARARARELRATREHEEEAHQRAALDRLADAVGDVAARSVLRLLEVLDGPALDLALVRGTCDALEAWPMAQRQPATVESARPLEPEAQRRLRDVLGEPLVLRVVPELIAGVRVTAPAGQIDGTARAFARRARQQVSAAARDEPTAQELTDG
ncbi:MAG: hypothetical protein AB1Z98_20685 [Nannocystaceae bacterium]